jgi:hypothetical protein
MVFEDYAPQLISGIRFSLCQGFEIPRPGRYQGISFAHVTPSGLSLTEQPYSRD